MPKDSATTNQLGSLIGKLQEEREQHVAAIAVIDATFAEFGITVAPRKRRGRPPLALSAAKTATKKVGKTAKPGKGRGRRTFAISGTESVLGFIRAAGKQGVPTAEIVKHWKSEGRSGNGFAALAQLLKKKKIKKENIVGGRGSRYRAA